MGTQRHTSARHNGPGRAGLPRFFTKQLLAFLLLAFAIIVVDFFLYTFIAISESERSFGQGTPITTVRAVDEGLIPANNGYLLSPEAADTLVARDAWALLIDPKGTVAWSQGAPADIPPAFTLNEVALAARYGNIADYPAFFWDRSDGLLVVGFPKGSYWYMALSYPESSMRNLPLYILLVFVVDLGILFAAYFVTRRRTQRAVAPIVDALDTLSEGRPAELALRGDLREIGDKITDTSAVIERKDAARANWIRGVSHDIRTPLSLILGHADAVAANRDAPEITRTQAQVIRAQGLRIRDLVADLNAASQLDYDMQPLHRERIHLARLLRAVVAAHANSGLDAQHPVELDIAESAAGAIVLGDERMLVRAVENCLANARVHNEKGCTVHVELRAEPADRDTGQEGVALVRIIDDGEGIAPAAFAELEARLARARTARSAAGCATGTQDTGTEHGLGLVLVDRITRAHGGLLALDDVEGSGFGVELRLPLA